MDRKLRLGLSLLIIAFYAAPLHAADGEDLCAGNGLFIRNLTMRDLWYEENGGECSFWNHDHIIVIKPANTLVIFSDFTCQARYCKNNPTYKDYKSADKNGNCRVKILPDCSLSDM